MSHNQGHGKLYEDYIKLAFPGSLDYKRSDLSDWDIEDLFDKEHNLCTSVKATKNAKSIAIDLADARKFWSINHSYRMIIGVWDQVAEEKCFHTLHEFLISLEEHKKLLGNLSFEEVNQFDSLIKEFGRGRHEEGRIFAQAYKIKINSKNRSVVSLAPKIGSDTQRRLQCSLRLKDLIKLCKNYTQFEKHDKYRGLNINFLAPGGKRKFREKSHY